MEKLTRFNLWYFMLALMALLLVQQWWIAERQVETIPYSQFEQLLNEGKVKDVVIADDVIRGTLREPTAEGRQEIVTQRVDPALAAKLAERGVTYTGIKESHFLADLLSWLLPILVFFGIWLLLFRRMAGQPGAGGLLSIGKSKAKVYMEKDTKVTFDDVAGVDEAKAELRELVEFLKNPEEYGRLGARIPKGVLLVGPPGAGKTLMARAVAGEAGVPFLSISGSEFVEMFVGVGAARVRDLFQQASALAPCIIFIDELDALGRARGVSPVSGGMDEKEQTLNQLLSELDGFDPRKGVVLLAATNRPEILDAALLRAGRFDRQVLLDRPDKLGRAAILKVHLKKIAAASALEVEKIAAMTPGFTGADLANLVNEAALLATRRKGTEVSLEDFTGAIERIVAGLEKKSRVMSPHERQVVAFHEIGHALVALALPGTDPVQKVSIIPRGIGALGYTLQRPIEDRYLMTKGELSNRMTVLLGGRAAEVLVFGELSTGAADDLAKATEIARNMVMRYGMDETLGHVTYLPDRPAFLGQVGLDAYPREFGEDTARGIDKAVAALVNTAFDRAGALLRKHRAALDETAARLLEKETLTEAELPRLLSVATGTDR